MAYKIISLCREIIEYELYMNKEKSIDEILEDNLNLAKEANLKSGQIIQKNHGIYHMTSISYSIPSVDEVYTGIEKQLSEIDNIFENFSDESSYEYIRNLFNKVLTYQFPIPKEISSNEFNNGISEMGFLPLPNDKELNGGISTGAFAFRIRANNSSIEENKSEYTIQSFWNAPDELVPIGRLNKEKESIFYIADSPRTAIKELKFNTGDMGYLNFYIAKEDVKLIPISATNNKISNIMLRLFSEDISIPDTYKYKLTREIAQKYYNYKVADLDGWIYPSIATNSKAKCAAVDKDKIHKLEFIGSARIKVIDDDYANIDHVVIPNNDGKPFYLKLGHGLNYFNKWLIDDYLSVVNLLNDISKDKDAINKISMN